MGLLRTVATVVLSISFIVFVALFGRLPVFRKTPVGLLHRALMVHVPHAIVVLDERITGRRITSSLHRFFDYVMNEPHPLVMIFFVLLQLISEVMFIPPAFKFIQFNPHSFTIPIVVMMPYITLYFSHTVQSTVTPTNHGSAIRAYPYDYVLYHPNMQCKTCHFSKPARSKHCSICNVCVQKQDHHCIWINNCVSRNNHTWFVALLLSMSVLLLYASILGYTILDSVLQRRLVTPELARGSSTSKRWSTKMQWRNYLDAWGLAIGLQPRIGAITLLATFTFPLATAFFAYHIYILWAGITTNESSKWSDLREDIYADLVWKARLEETRAEYPDATDQDGNIQASNRAWQLKYGPNSTAQWWIVRTRNGVQPVRQKWGGRDSEHEPDLRWKRVRSLNNVHNIYDLGFKENTKDALFNTERAPDRSNQ